MGRALPVTRVRVVDVERITPRTARVGFTADELPGLLEDRPDQQLKLCLPRAGQTVPRLPEPAADDPYGMRWFEAYLAIPEAERPWMRSFTVRSYDRERNVMAVDFVLHGEGGPAARWGAAARPGDVLGMVGPSSLYARPLPAARRMLLAGDEAALPAVATVLEALPAGTSAIVYAEVRTRRRSGSCRPPPEGPRCGGSTGTRAARSSRPYGRPAPPSTGWTRPGWRARRPSCGTSAATWWGSADCPRKQSSSAGTGGAP
ncbi:Siderophore-interacting protein [Streptomyces sp. AmelKG-D3]|nr:Siderophore-interacting protein [Streptomyces sp. AmelKG-D3]